MENSSSSFTDLLNSSNSSGNPENPTPQPNFPIPHYPMNYPPPQFAPNFHSHYSHTFNPFVGQQNYPQFSSTQGGYGSPYQGYMMSQYPRPVGETSPVGSIPFFAGSRGNSSRGDESSPVDPSSPVSISQHLAPDPADREVVSDSSPNEAGKTEGRVH